MKKLVALFLSLVLVLTCTAALADLPVLVMGTNAAFPPYEFIGDDGQPTGIDIEIAEAVCADMGYTLVVRDMEFDSIISDVQFGKIDFGMAGMTVTEERLQSVNFSETYATGIQAIIVKEDSEIASVDDLYADGATWKVGVQDSTTGDIYCTDDFGEDRVSKYAVGADAVEALKTGKVDCVIIDNEPAKAYVAANEGLKILESTYAVEDYAICVNLENTELLEKINGALTELIEDGTVDAIVAKYISAE